MRDSRKTVSVLATPLLGRLLTQTDQACLSLARIHCLSTTLELSLPERDSPTQLGIITST